MFDLFRMELFKLRKHKLTWGAAIVCFVVTFVLPLIGKLFAGILYNIVKDSGEAQAVAEAKNLVDAFNSPLEFSSLLKMPFGGISLVLILVFVSASSFLFLDIGGGYIKNIAGQIPSRGHSCYGKYAVVCLQGLLCMLSAFLGGVIGTLIVRGISFDSDIPAGILEFALKWLILCGIDAVLLLFTTGLGNKVLGIVMAVIFGTGALGMIYMPLSFGIRALFRLEDFELGGYMPDQMISASPMNVWASLIGGAVMICVFLPLTVMLLNKRDVK